MGEIKTPLIELQPGETFTADENGAFILADHHSHADLIRYVVGDIGENARMLGYSDFSVEPCSSLNHLAVLKRLHCWQRYMGSPCLKTFSLGSRI